MPILDWIGKKSVVNHDKEVPFRLLKRIDSLSVGESENLIIKGDNLEALKALLPYYYGKVKCVSIDPPYNTGKEHWVYSDRVNSTEIRKWLGSIVGDLKEDLSRHDKWLCMMYPRLSLLKQLLSEDGIIFVNIDDNEIQNLLNLMDEIFLEKNRLAVLVWDLGTGTTAGHFTRAHEYVVVYAKNKDILPNFKNIEDGENIVHGALKKPSKANPYSEIEFPSGIEYEGDNSIFEGEIGGSEKIRILSKQMVFKNGRLKNPVRLEAGWAMRNQILSWLAGEETYDSKGQKVTKFFFNKNGILWYEKEKDIINPQTMLRKLGSTKNGGAVVQNILGKKAFDFPKPVELLKFLIQLITDKDSIILDSFAGSGTTAHAVLELNKEDSGNRKFILVEMENDIARKVTAERVKRVIKGYSFKNSKDESIKVEGLGGGFQFMNLDTELFDAHGLINDDITFIDLARYIFFSETKLDLKEKAVKDYFIGENNGTEYYLIFKQGKENILNEKVISKFKKTAKQKIVYTDSCTLDDEVLDEHRIIFKQIPYEVRGF